MLPCIRVNKDFQKVTRTPDSTPKVMHSKSYSICI